MNYKAYILSIPESLTIDDLLREEPDLYDYIEDVDIYEVLQEVKNNIETNISGNIEKISILYFIVDYASSNNNLLGELKISGNVEKIINIEAKGTNEETKNHILQHGLVGDIVRRLDV